jgi:acyl-CoA reductase-like NAD-dependent aldehyde dehydrogenase
MRSSREEIFGPAASVIRVKDYDEALAIANDTDFRTSADIVDVAEIRVALQAREPGWNDHGQPAHRGCRLSRAVRRTQG